MTDHERAAAAQEETHELLRQIRDNIGIACVILAVGLAILTFVVAVHK